MFIVNSFIYDITGDVTNTVTSFKTLDEAAEYYIKVTSEDVGDHITINLVSYDKETQSFTYNENPTFKNSGKYSDEESEEEDQTDKFINEFKWEYTADCDTSKSGNIKVITSMWSNYCVDGTDVRHYSIHQII